MALLLRGRPTQITAQADVTDNVPGVQEFWTDEEVTLSTGYGAEVVDDDDGSLVPIPENNTWPMICVTDPSA